MSNEHLKEYLDEHLTIGHSIEPSRQPNILSNERPHGRSHGRSSELLNETPDALLNEGGDQAFGEFNGLAERSESLAALASAEAEAMAHANDQVASLMNRFPQSLPGALNSNEMVSVGREIKQWIENYLFAQRTSTATDLKRLDAMQLGIVENALAYVTEKFEAYDRAYGRAPASHGSHLAQLETLCEEGGLARVPGFNLSEISPAGKTTLGEQRKLFADFRRQRYASFKHMIKHHLQDFTASPNYQAASALDKHIYKRIDRFEYGSFTDANTQFRYLFQEIENDQAAMDALATLRLEDLYQTIKGAGYVAQALRGLQTSANREQTASPKMYEVGSDLRRAVRMALMQLAALYEMTEAETVTAPESGSWQTLNDEQAEILSIASLLTQIGQSIIKIRAKARSRQTVNRKKREVAKSNEKQRKHETLVDAGLRPEADLMCRSQPQEVPHEEGGVSECALVEDEHQASQDSEFQSTRKGLSRCETMTSRSDQNQQAARAANSRDEGTELKGAQSKSSHRKLA